jgi:hypothetical protein
MLNNMDNETYLAQTICLNCGYRNYPQWQEFKFGTRVGEYKCLQCDCKTLIPDNNEKDNELYNAFIKNGIASGFTDDQIDFLWEYINEIAELKVKNNIDVK